MLQWIKFTVQFAKWCLDWIRHYISFRIFFSFRSVGGPDCWRMLCNLSVNCDPPDTTRYDGKNTVVKRLACVRGSILIGCAPISQFPSKNFKGKYSKKNQSHKISERKNNFVLSFTKNVRLFKHHDLLACVIVCNSCEKSWFWQPENTLITHYSVRICADVWPLCWQSRVCHTTLRRLGRRKQRNAKGNLFELKHHCLIWEFKKRRRRRHGRSWLKNELILYLRISRYSKVI